MKRSSGFTIIELGITLAILAIAVSIAMPNFNAWMRKIEVRNAGESVLHALQLARSEAIKRNSTVSLTLTGTTGWTMTDSAGATIQSRPSGEGTQNASISIIQPASGTPFVISFNSLGRLSAPNTAVSLSAVGTAGAECTASGPAGCVVILVSMGGLIRMCDPNPSKAGTPQGC